ncbi:hypothetical protein VP1G_08148 [Cytospora mali]|uniref:Uncharacterized protein n=1 Tax=Cytospora mali TaxID=578113 RepID=A0A194VAS9_CYTMA|nr:hypothetical protein VP1G_08148 [Valsa mali var. pyri (nom. inval.)]
MNIDAQSSSSFFALPGEIRENIYAYYLTFHYSDFDLSSRPFYTFWGEQAFSKRLPALMLSCKRAYDEMRPRVHEEAVMRACMFEHGRRIGFAVHGNLRVPRLRRLVFLVAMEHPNWNTWMKFFGDIVRSAEGLKELVVDWEPRRAASSGGIGYLAQQESRMEKRFFEVIAGAPSLEAVRLHGDVPPHWAEKLKGMIANRQDKVVKVICLKERWWREDHEDAASTTLRRTNGAK